MLSADDARTLRWVDGFRELPAEDIRRISAQCRWKWYQPQQLIFSQSDTANDMFFVVQGKVRITSYSTIGKEVSFRDLTVGDCFGDLAAIDARPRSAAAVAISDALLASMPAQTYWQTLMTYPPVAAACLRRLANLVRALSDRVIEYSLLPVPTRIKLELLRLAERQMRGSNSAEIDPAPTHMEIAARVATHREAVTRELRRLAKDRIVTQEGRKLVITDIEALRASVGNLQEIDPSLP
ncbi:MAG TPA: Crp/Fnr family transcriptional regulator [Candidatus Angelobacter sp.]|nr:Crp/Fnr family transcriptional regulator [Candidatus Angelobacter sp.]